MSDPLVLRWISTWAHLRGCETETVDGWPLVHVDSPSRRTELICVDPGVDAFGSLLVHIAGDPEAMLTVVGTDLAAYRAMPLPGNVRVDRDDETLMTAVLSTVLTSGPVPAAPTGLNGEFESDGPRTIYRLDDGERVAAEATMGVFDGWAAFDAVETTPAFRRQGLGRHVMAALCSRALAAGTTRGVLVASADGRSLYTSLGWQIERQLLSLMGTHRS